MSLLKTLMERRDKLIKDQRAMIDKADKEKRDFTAEEDAEYEARDQDLEDIMEKIKNEKDPSRQGDLNAIFASYGTGTLNETRQQHSTFSAAESRSKLVQAAKQATEGLPDDVWRRYLTMGEAGLSHNEKVKMRERRALSTSADIYGGYLAPADFLAEVLKGLDNDIVLWQRCRHITLKQGLEIKAPYLDADPDAFAFRAENEDIASKDDTTMSFEGRALMTNRLAGLIKVSKALIATGAVDVGDFVSSRMAYQMAATVEEEIIGGTAGPGSGAGRPLGIFTTADAGIGTDRDVTASAQNSFTADDVLDTIFNLKSQYHRRAILLCHRLVLRDLRKKKDGEGNYLFAPATDRGPSTVAGVPIVLSEYAPHTFTTTKPMLVVFDPNFYMIAEAYGSTVEVLRERFSTSHEDGYLFTHWLDGMPIVAEAFSRLVLA